MKRSAMQQIGLNIKKDMNKRHHTFISVVNHGEHSHD